MNERNKTKPLQVGDVVVIPPTAYWTKRSYATVILACKRRNWCRLKTQGLEKGEGRMALTLSRVEEFARVSK